MLNTPNRNVYIEMETRTKKNYRFEIENKTPRGGEKNNEHWTLKYIFRPTHIAIKEKIVFKFHKEHWNDFLRKKN